MPLQCKKRLSEAETRLHCAEQSREAAQHDAAVLRTQLDAATAANDTASAVTLVVCLDPASSCLPACRPEVPSAPETTVIPNGRLGFGASFIDFVHSYRSNSRS